MVTIELRASGIAATARATANKMHLRYYLPQDTDSEQNTTEYKNQDGKLLSELIQVHLQWSPLFQKYSSEVLRSFPTSVSIPISVTRNEPLP